MNLENDLRSVLGDLADDELTFLAELQKKATPSESIDLQYRVCRGEFVAELINRLSLDDLVTKISLHNMEVSSSISVISLQSEKSVSLIGLRSEHPIDFSQSAFNQLDLSDCQIPSLKARSIHLQRDIVLKRARISQTLDLSLARIGGSADLRQADLTAPEEANSETLHLSGDTSQSESGQTRRESYSRFHMGSFVDSQIDGSIRCCDARLDRKIRLTNTRIAGDLDLWGSEFVDLEEHENGLICTNCKIGEKFVFSETSCGKNTRLALDYSRMRILQFGRDQDKWPLKNRISLEGTTF